MECNLNLIESEKKNIQIIRLPCRSIRIGSHKFHHPINNVYLPLYITVESITFHAPILNDSNTIINITLRSADISKIWVHFGRSLPIMFIFTTATFGKDVRNALHMVSIYKGYFDPEARDETLQKITFIIDFMTDEQCNFIRHCFFGDKVKEIDEKEANEILLKSTPIPFQHILFERRLKAANKQEAPVLQPEPSIRAPNPLPALLATPNFKMLTYPAPPQTGGILVTFNDFFHLNYRRHLNDTIIAFYIRYIFNERLTPIQREKTHIFSSFFYSRLTQEPERPQPVKESIRDIQVRRHGLVKTWTRKMDIFSKDFIFVPVSEDEHWVLAVICFPGKVPEVSESASKPEAKNNKPPENATSNHEQESSSESKVIIRELSNNAEGDNLNQDENSANSINSAYLVEESPVFDKLSPESTECTSIPKEGARREMPCICIFDSLKGLITEIPALLQEYLEMEWESKKGTKKVFDRNTMPDFLMKCPQQENLYDCGMYVLKFVESFFKNPIPYFGNPMPDLTDWFSASEIPKMRHEIKELIFSIHQTQVERANAGRVRPPPEAAQGDPNAVPQNDNR